MQTGEPIIHSRLSLIEDLRIVCSEPTVRMSVSDRIMSLFDMVFFLDVR